MELLQVFDENKNMLNESIERENKKSLTNGKHFMIVLLFIENEEKKFLIQKTSVEKQSQFATTGGHATIGDDSLKTVIKEAQEELGIKFKEDELKFIDTIDHGICFCDIYYTNKKINIEDLKLQDEEVEYIDWYTIDEIEKMKSEGTFRKGNIVPLEKVLEKTR
ncbi:MAG: NUDIX domain-containing protein [Lactobacillales bacterium]|nr:NUDIX domain-containing protein [Lactobacillales bacterium]